MLGVIQGLFLSFFFLIKSKKIRVSNIFLGIILFFFAVYNLDFWAAYSRYTLKFPFLLDISTPLSMAMGPLLYHYIYSTVKNKTDKHLLWHYIPFAFFFLYSMFFIIQPAGFKYNVFISSRNIDLPLKEITLTHSFDPFGIRNISDYLFSVQLIIYLTMSCSIFIRYLKSRNMKIFEKNDANLNWVRNILLMTLLIVLITVTIQLFFPGGRVEFLLAVCFTFFIYFTSIRLIGDSVFFNQALFREKYLKSSLTGDMKLEYHNSVLTLMRDEKPYLDSLFSIKRFSKLSGIQPDHLSQVLNECCNQSFFEFTRSYRIEEAKRLLSIPENSEINIEEIAHKVGYNSKSAFNKAFLNLTGQTPLSFKKNQKIIRTAL